MSDPSEKKISAGRLKEANAQMTFARFAAVLRLSG